MPRPNRSAIWPFWMACAVAAAGGVVPILLAGTSGRTSSVIIPFWIGAAGFAAGAVFSGRGRGVTTAIYLAAGLAVVYGMLGMLAVLLQLSVLTTCPAKATCGPGFTQPLTSAEFSGLGYSMALGSLALALGYAGLRVIYRRRSFEEPAPPPVRKIAPMAPLPAAVEPTPSSASSEEAQAAREAETAAEPEDATADQSDTAPAAEEKTEV